MDYIGENLLPGKLGNFFIILSLVASLMATIAYFLSTKKSIANEENRWIKLARIAFLTEVVSVLAVFGILFYIISNHLFEYKYAWQHSSLSLEAKYLLACFWEGQEGSFLLWSVWHCVLGLIIIKKAKYWEAPVMTVLSFAQFCLATMIAGIYIFGHKVGSNPFVLLRNEMEAPIFLNPDYLSFIKDGNDLNPLLQNYWMVIHPPVLFMGFASVIIPFAYAIAGLYTKRYKEWIKPALPWALFSAAVLGGGLMMGAMWAYESLTFGGYWAWDPVENASLVPWLILVSGIHTMLIYQHTGRSLRSTFLFTILSFLLILYSTFLTRSGILGDSSVHAFTDLGMNFQLLLFLLLFVIPAAILFMYHFKKIPHIAKEEEATSREFWMFIGSLVLLISAVSIIIMTSIPVVNKIASLFAGQDKALFKPLAIGENSEHSYNQIQIFVAISIGLLTGFTQYLKYKKTGIKYFLKKAGWPILGSLFIGALILFFGDINYDKQGLGFLMLICTAIVCSVYAILANLSYVWIGLKGNLKSSGASVAHTGFGLVLLGILISASKKEILSINTSSISAPMGEGSTEKPGENLTLLKGARTSMDNYWVTYKTDSAHPQKPLWYYKIQFEKKDGEEKFTLTPNAFVNYKGVEGLMSNPDAKHYWNHDVFTYITSLPDPEKTKDTSQYEAKQMKKGDTVLYNGGSFILERLLTKNNVQTAGLEAGDIASIVTIKVLSKNNAAYTAEPILISRNNQSYLLPDTVSEERLIFQLRNVKGENIEVGVKQSNVIVEYVTLKVYKFPFINLLWIGVFITVIGFLMSMARRIRMGRMKMAEQKYNREINESKDDRFIL
ncbi:MAG TPA: cytochrome c biogenesis protein CcsA [Bacteroidia bacterium]|jgi:cytochrome c-type biogenesis protein CcmF|nr:cytochrome c biogenesis protein CcsA [Bacteroidia bacterium]